MTETIFVADAHRGDTQRFIVRAREKLTPFRFPPGGARSRLRLRRNALPEIAPF
jgi:hypothetical protein